MIVNSQSVTISDCIFEDMVGRESGYGAITMYRTSYLDDPPPTFITLENNCFEGYDTTFAIGRKVRYNGTFDAESIFATTNNYQEDITLTSSRACLGLYVNQDSGQNSTCEEFFDAGSCPATSTSRVAPCFYGLFTPFFCPSE